MRVSQLVEAREIVWLLLLIPLGIVLGIGAFFFYCSWRRSTLIGGNSFESSIAPRFRANSFDQPTRWLAVKASNPAVVQAALKLHHPVTASWEEGLAEAREDKLFISPSIGGWVLVVGSGLPEAADDSDKCYHFLTALSRKLGHVQFFSVSRFVHYHTWVLLERGHVFRGYAWAGETLWNQGPLTAAEKDLKLLCLEYASDQSAYSVREALSLNSDKIYQLAARWSIDPSAISPEMWRGRGIVGEFSQPNAH